MIFLAYIRAFFQKPKLIRQLLFWFLIIAIPAEIFLTYVSYQSAERILKQEIQNNLSAISAHQVEEISDYLYNKETEIQTLASISDVIKAMQDFANIAQNDSKIAQENTEKLMFYQSQYKFLNLYLINNQADIIFSLDSKTSKLNLRKDSVFKNSELAYTFERCLILMQTDISNFSYQTYSQTYDLLISTPIYKDKKMIGVLVAEIDLQEIEKLTSSYVGLGQTGETVIGIKKEKEIWFINKVRKERSSTIKKKIPFDPNISLGKAVSGEKGNGLVRDYRNIEVISRWEYIPVLQAGIVVEIDTDEAFVSLKDLQKQLFGIVVFTISMMVIAAYFLAKSISKPIVSLTNFAKKAEENNTFRQAKIEAKNEIGTLAMAFNQMLAKIQSKNEELEEYSHSLEQKVKERTAEIEEQKYLLQMQLEESTVLTEEVSERNEELNQINEELRSTIEVVKEQKEEIESKTKKITDSINYAYRIQKAMLSSQQEINTFLPECFIFFKPKDIVSGDFYWFADKPNCLIIAAIDCTGHGVPGAFMSMIANDMLNQIVHDREIHQPDFILNKLNEYVRKSLKQNETENRDGMDVSVICMLKIEENFDLLTYAGAMNPLYYIQKGVFHEIKADKKAIGGRQQEERTFALHQVVLDTATTFYLCSDGFQDQFGGKDNRKFMVRRFKELLFEMHQKPISEQENILENTLENWKMGNEQVDDILVIGAKVDGFVFPDGF